MHSHRTELNCGSVSSTGVHSIDRWRQDASSKKLGEVIFCLYSQ